MSDQDQDHQDQDQDHIEEIVPQEEEFEDDLSDQDYYDPEEDLAFFHEQKLRIEESWLEWERQFTVNNRQNPGYNYRYNIFQKPGSAKRRERRHLNALASSHRAGSGSSSPAPAAGGATTGARSPQRFAAGTDSDLGSSSAAAEKLRQLGSYRPALASSIVHSYSNLSWEATQAAREKRLAAKAELNGKGENIICTLPIEILSHIVSHLEPSELFNVSLVCQLLYHVVNADSCWKEAFIKFFGASIPFKRLDPKSWRGEYIKRTRLLRRWEKGRGSNVVIDPKIGQISKLWAPVDNKSSEGWFLAGGLAEGVVARCSPTLGKVQKDAVFRMVHLVNAEVAVMAMDRHRVLWGLTTGQVSLTTLSYGTAGQTFQTFAGFHDGSVSCVKLVPNHLGFVLTGGVDGIVKLWDVSKARTVCDFRTGSSLIGNTRTRIDHICCEPGSRIIAGTSSGEIYVWEVDIASIIAPGSATTSGISTPARSASSDNLSAATLSVTPAAIMPDVGDLAGSLNTSATQVLPNVIKLPEEFKGVGYLEVDFGIGHIGLILAQATDEAVMHLYSLETLIHLATLKSPAHFTPISAVHWDIPKYEKPMISPSNGARSLVHLHGRHEMSSLLATGDHTGNICLWYLSDILRRQELLRKDHDLHPSQTIRETLMLEPICVLKGHDARVTSLFVDKLVIVSGSADGWAKAWNPVNGELISVLNSGYIRGREMNDMTSSAVKCIVVNSQQCRGIVSIGGLIRSWDFSPEANLSKDKYRKHVAKKPLHYSAGPKNKIQNDIRHSLEETVSLKRLEDQAKERQEQIRRRYNNLEGLNMVDMTDEEVVEYVMMLSKDQEDQNAVQEVLEMERIREMELLEHQHALLLQELSSGGEGPSSPSSVLSAPVISEFSSSSTTIPPVALDADVSQQELEEEEELVRRAIEMSMLDMEPVGDDHHSYNQHEARFDALDTHGLESIHSCSHDQAVEWESSKVIDVDAQDHDDLTRSEDQRIVQSILQELQETETEDIDSESPQKQLKQDHEDRWPSISASSSSTAVATDNGSSSHEGSVDSKPKTMTWSMVARSNSETSLASNHGQSSLQQIQQAGSRQRAIIKQYPQRASQEEIEDDDTQLARILSLSMVEK